MKAWIVLLLSLAGVAHADDGEARRAYDDGVKAYNLQSFKLALTLFQHAYAARPHPALLYNIGQAQRQLGQYEQAALSYRAYVSQIPDSPTREQVAQLATKMDDAARVVRASAPPSGVQLAPPPPPAEVRAPAQRRTWYRNVPGLVVAGAGLVVAGAGGGLLGAGALRLDDARHALTLPELHQLQNQSDNLTVAGWSIVGVGAAALLTGAIVLAVRR